MTERPVVLLNAIFHISIIYSLKERMCILQLVRLTTEYCRIQHRLYKMASVHLRVNTVVVVRGTINGLLCMHVWVNMTHIEKKKYVCENAEIM